MTQITIEGEKFYIDGKPTYAGQHYQDYEIEGLLLNSRMIQATFDDENPATRGRWAYPDTKQWDADRNNREFVAAVPTYRQHGLLAVTVNFQGGSPEGYSKDQPWINSAFEVDGSFKPAYLDRMKRTIDALKAAQMVAILGIFYFGQDERLVNEAAVKQAVDNAVEWVFAQDYHNVLIEINNECNIPAYEHEILRPHRVHELIEQVKSHSHEGRRLLVGTSYGGGSIPTENVVRGSDFLLMHGNGVSEPDRIAQMVDEARAVPGYQPMPILFNEDDHFDFDQPYNNFIAAVSKGASWGYFDPGDNNYQDGYQSPPVQWGINTPRKQGFFDLVRRMTQEE